MDLLCAVISNRGRQIIVERGVDERWIENYVYLFELLLQFEQFMKMREIPRKYLIDERRLGKAMDHLMYIIDNTIHRGEGTMGNNIIKNHLLLHIPQYTSRWGPPTGMDSGDPERNHKFEVKPQAKWTQRREYSFQEQFGSRWHETRLVTRAVNSYKSVHGLFGGCDQPELANSDSDDEATVVDNTPKVAVELNGSHFDIGINSLGLPSMGWTDSYKRGRTTLPQPVVDFICYSVLDKVAGNTIHGRTEVDVVLDGCKEKFRAHPNYRADSNQRIHMWYDWARFKYSSQGGRELELPGQIAAIIEIGKLKEDNRRNIHKVRGTELKANTNYAVVRLFRQEPKLFRKSTLPGMWYTYSVKWGKVREGFFLLPLDTIVGTTIVVPNVKEDPDSKARAEEPLDGGFFVFPSRDQLGNDFLDVIIREQQDLEGISLEDYQDDDSSGCSSGSNKTSDSGSSDGSTHGESEDESDEDEEPEAEEPSTCRRVNYSMKHLAGSLDKLNV